MGWYDALNIISFILVGVFFGWLVTYLYFMGLESISYWIGRRTSMTNKEFYGDKLLAVVLKGDCDALYKMVHGESCMGLFCGDCEFGITKESEIENVLQWLNAEHEEPPLLENGDGLRPGDLIMVRASEDFKWSKRQFMCYFNHKFYCVNNIEQTMDENTVFNASSWAQARLPKGCE